MSSIASSSSLSPDAGRIAWLDTVRVIACFLVVVSHSTDAYILDPVGAFFVSGCRACVPLFVMISGALLLPMRGTGTEFFKRRLSRVIVPFLIWGVILALLPIPGKESEWAPSNVATTWVEGQAHSSPDRILYNIGMLPLNFTNSNIHFWFLYIILGLYLFIPVISPWVKQTSTKGLVAFLSVWTFTLFLPYVQHFPGHNLFPALHGECDWNSRGMTFYFGGYLGYLLLGHLLTRLPKLAPARAIPLGILLFAIGWAITHHGFLYTVVHQQVPKDLEFFIEFLSPNVALMTIGVFLFCQAIPLGGRTGAIIHRGAVLSFGIFLIHYWTLLWVRDWMLAEPLKHLGAGVAIPLLAITTFAIASLIAWLVSFVPGRRWLLG